MVKKKAATVSRHNDGRLESVKLRKLEKKYAGLQVVEEPKKLPKRKAVQVKINGHVLKGHTTSPEGTTIVLDDDGDDEPIIAVDPPGEPIVLHIRRSKTGRPILENIPASVRFGVPALKNGNTVPEEFKVLRYGREIKPIKLKGKFLTLFEHTNKPLQIGLSKDQQAARDQATSEYTREYPRKHWPPAVLDDATPLPSLGLAMWMPEKTQLELDRMLKEMRGLSTRVMQEVNEIVRSGKYHCAPQPETRRRLILSLVQEIRENLDDLIS